jgi:hypothetical protein
MKKKEEELEGLVGCDITNTGGLGATSRIVRLTPMPMLSYWDPETFGYNLRWLIAGSERIDCVEATKVDGHYVLYFGTYVLGVAVDREEANRRLREKLEDKVRYANENFTHRRTYRFEIKDQTGGSAPDLKVEDERCLDLLGPERSGPIRLRKRLQRSY